MERGWEKLKKLCEFGTTKLHGKKQLGYLRPSWEDDFKMLLDKYIVEINFLKCG